MNELGRIFQENAGGFLAAGLALVALLAAAPAIRGLVDSIESNSKIEDLSNFPELLKDFAAEKGVTFSEDSDVLAREILPEDGASIDKAGRILSQEEDAFYSCEREGGKKLDYRVVHLFMYPRGQIKFEQDDIPLNQEQLEVMKEALLLALRKKKYSIRVSDNVVGSRFKDGFRSEHARLGKERRKLRACKSAVSDSIGIVRQATFSNAQQVVDVYNFIDRAYPSL